MRPLGLRLGQDQIEVLAVARERRDRGGARGGIVEIDEAGRSGRRNAPRDAVRTHQVLKVDDLGRRDHAVVRGHDQRRVADPFDGGEHDPHGSVGLGHCGAYLRRGHPLEVGRTVRSLEVGEDELRALRRREREQAHHLLSSLGIARVLGEGGDTNFVVPP